MSASSDSGDAPQIELLSAWFCPYAQRAWIALEEKCPGKFTVTESMTIDTPSKRFEKTALLLEKNAKGQVPVIIDRRGDNGDKGAVVYESLVCVEYVDEAVEDGTKLLPGPPSQRARARMMAQSLNDEICTQFYILLMKQEKGLQEKATEKMLRGLRDFSRQCEGPFFFGAAISVVDIAIAPWVVGVRLDVLKHYRKFEVPKTEEYTKYWTWAEAVSNHPSFVATASNDRKGLMDVYGPYVEGSGYSTAPAKK